MQEIMLRIQNFDYETIRMRRIQELPFFCGLLPLILKLLNVFNFYLLENVLKGGIKKDETIFFG